MNRGRCGGRRRRRRRRRLLLKLAPRILHEQILRHKLSIIGGLERLARVAGRLEVNERVRVVQDQALDDVAVRAKELFDLLLGARLGKVAHVHDLGGGGRVRAARLLAQAAQIRIVEVALAFFARRQVNGELAALHADSVGVLERILGRFRVGV